MKILLCSLLIICSVSFFSCSTPPPPNVTLGQELTDLDRAYQGGVIKKREFKKAKKKLLKSKRY